MNAMNIYQKGLKGVPVIREGAYQYTERAPSVEKGFVKCDNEYLGDLITSYLKARTIGDSEIAIWGHVLPKPVENIDAVLIEIMVDDDFETVKTLFNREIALWLYDSAVDLIKIAASKKLGIMYTPYKGEDQRKLDLYDAVITANSYQFDRVIIAPEDSLDYIYYTLVN